MKFREFTTLSGKMVLAGKDRETNELLIKQVEKDNWVLHTKEKGSPFAEIKTVGKKTNKKDIKETAIFISRYSQDWKKNKRDIIVHYFKGKDIYKEKGMSIGTFLVKKFKEIKVKKEEVENAS
jgi:predicted ribosome quality control (RQC) complex YloA/Tae2 family protein